MFLYENDLYEQLMSILKLFLESLRSVGRVRPRYK